MRNITFFVLLVGAAAAVGCGDDEPNRNPMAPSAMQSSASIQEATSAGAAGSGGSVGVVPAAGSPFDGQVRGAAPVACIPAQAIIDAAERNRQANNRPPGFGRSWKELLAFFGEDWPDEPVTLAEMDARVGRWAGWAPFRDEVARLIDCGWTPPTSIQVEPEDTPMPQQAPAQSWSASPSTATITEGTSGTLVFKISPSPAPGQTGCRLRGYMTFTMPGSGHPSGLSLTGDAPNAATLNGHPGWNDPNCGNQRLTSGADIGSRNYRLTYSSTSDGLAKTYTDIEVFFNDLPNDNNLNGGSANLVATISIVDDGAGEPGIVKQSCDGTHPTSGAWAFTEGDKAISYPDGTRIEDDNIVQGDRCGTIDGTAFRAIDDDIAYVQFRKTGGVATPSQTSGSVELNMTCKQWYEAIWTHNLDFGRTGITAMQNEFKASNCVADISRGTPADDFNGYVNIGTWDWIPWTKTPGTMTYPDVDCSWLRGATIDPSVMYGHRRDRDNRKPLREVKDGICTTWTVAGARWTVDITKPVKVDANSWIINYRQGQPTSIGFRSGTARLTGETGDGPWDLAQAPCGKPSVQAIDPVRSDQIVLEPGSFEPCS